MPKTDVQFHLYKHPWPLVIEAYFRRYPKHPRLPVLLSTEVLQDTTDPVTKIRHIQRKCVVDVEAPMWLKRALRQYDFVFMQKTQIDPAKQSMKIVNTNVTYAGTIVLGDQCEYHSDPNNPNWTIFEQQAEMQLPNFPFSKQCENYMIKSYERNTSSGRNIDGSFIEDVVREGWYSRNPSLISQIGSPPDIPPDLVPTSITSTDSVRGHTRSKDDEAVSQPKPLARLSSTNSLNQKSRRRLAHDVQSRKKPTVKPAPYAQVHGVAMTLFAVGLAVVALLPQLLQLMPVSDGLRSPATLSLLATAASLGWILLHMRIFPGAWRDLFLVVDTSDQAREAGVPHVILEESDSAEDAENDGEEDLGDDGSDQDDSIHGDGDSEELLETKGHLSHGSHHDGSSRPGSRNSLAGDDDIVRRSTIHDNDVRAVREEEIGMSFRLEDCFVSVPAWIERFCFGRLEEVFIVDVHLKSGASWSVEKLASEFLWLHKSLPQSSPTLSFLPLPKKKHSDHSLSVAIEDRRRLLEAYLQSLVNDAKLIHLPQSSLIVNFLRRRIEALSQVSVMSLGSKDDDKEKETCIRKDALSKARWRNCWKDMMVVLEPDRVDFYCNHIKIAHCVVNLTDITEVALLDQRPFSSNFFCVIATENDAHFIYNKSEDLLRSWIQDVLTERDKRIGRTGSSRSVSIPQSYRRPFKPDIDQRVILNNRSLSWALHNTKSACNLSGQLLREALELFRLHASAAHMSPTASPFFDRMNKFLKDVCELQACPVSRMSDAEKLAFFCNVYHILCIHATLELGEPGTLLRRRAYSHAVCYDLQGRLFSLMEIEHCILRGSMSKPHIFWSALVIPRFSKKDSRCDCVVEKSEPRLNFVLDAGTYSSPYFCWILDPEHLDLQLDHAAQHFLKDEVHINISKRTVTLPRICQWYSHDMGSSSLEVLRYIVKFMPMEQGQDLQRLLETSGSIKIRYKEYDWNQRGWFYAGDSHLDSCSLSQPS